MENEFGDKNLFSDFESTNEQKKTLIIHNEINNHNTETNINLKILQEQVEKLTKMNEELKKQARLLHSVKNESIEEQPSIQILFYDDDFSRLFKSSIEDFVYSLISRPIFKKLSNLSNRPNFVNISNECGLITSQRIISSCKYFNNMIIDKLGWPLTDNEINKSSSWIIPRFFQPFNKAYPDPEEEGNEFKLPQRQKIECFNCGGGHSISQCQEKKDFQKIANNKNKFMQNREPVSTNGQNKWTSSHKIPSDDTNQDLAIYNETIKKEVFEEGELIETTAIYPRYPVMPFPMQPPPNMYGRMPFNLRLGHQLYRHQMQQYIQPFPMPQKRRSDAELEPKILPKQVRLDTSADMDIEIDTEEEKHSNIIETSTPVSSKSYFQPIEVNDLQSASEENSVPSHVSLSISFDLGTPIAFDLSKEEGSVSYNQLPQSNKFAAGISDHINFENLPGSTGAFNRIKNLFKGFKS